jgi:hypothetical protein
MTVMATHFNGRNLRNQHLYLSRQKVLYRLNDIQLADHPTDL